MERLPLFISFAALLLWALNALFVHKRLKLASRGIGLGLALVQLSGAIWAAARVFSSTSGVSYQGVWFAVSPTEVFHVSFIAETGVTVLWLAVSAYAALTAYFSLLSQIKGSRSQLRGEAVSVPLLTLGAVISLTSANFITFYFGWALITFMGFLAQGFSAPTQEERAAASFRYLVLGVLPEVVFLAGLLGCYTAYGTLAFSEINQRGVVDGAGWAILCLILGAMLRNLQMPLMQRARHLALARNAATPVLFIGHAIVSVALFAKLYPAISISAGISYFAIIPAITAICAAVMALPEEDPAMLIGWWVSYLCSSVFLSGLAGDYHAAIALALTGSIAGFLLASALLELPDNDQGAKWLVSLSVVMLTGLPLGGWGWARYLEYVGLASHQSEATWLHWMLLSLKVLADLMMGIALWGVARERWMVSTDKTKPKLEVVLPLALLCIACVSVAVGGRPFGGMAGMTANMPEIAWFERLVDAPESGAKQHPHALELVGSDADIIARLVVLGIFLLTGLIALLWVYRDRRSSEEFRSFCRRALGKLAQPSGQHDSKLWDWILRPLSHNLGKAAAYFDSRVVDYVLADIWIKPARAVRNAFVFVEKSVIDHGLIDGLGEAIGTLGKSLRLVQNGQVQFYFSLGLILMGAVVIKFVVVGGS